MKEQKTSTNKSLKILNDKDAAQIKGGLQWYTGGDGGPPPYEPKGKKDKKSTLFSAHISLRVR